MARWRRRISQGGISFFLNLLLVMLSFLLVLANINEKAELEKFSHGYANDYAVSASAQVQDPEAWKQQLRQAMDDGCRLYQTALSTEIDLRGIAWQGKADLPPLLEGRFFTEEECWSDSKLALVGSALQDKLQDSGDKKVLPLRGEEYEVIGSIGSGRDSRLDSMVLLPMGVALAYSGGSGSFVFDARSEADAKDFFARAASGSGAAVKEKYRLPDIQTRGGTQDTIRMIYAGALLTFVLSTIASTLFWVRRRQQAMEVRRLIGASGRQIINAVLAQWGKVAGAAVLTGCAAAVVMSACGWLYALRPVDLLFSAGCTILASLLIVSTLLLWRLTRTVIRPAR